MGYETELLIGRVTHGVCEENGVKWFQVYATIDLCKCGVGSHIGKLNAHHNGKPIVYWYGSDGNTRITGDKYGDSPLPLPIGVVLDALAKDVKSSDYRRFKWAHALLEAMNNDTEELSVLLYGH